MRRLDLMLLGIGVIGGVMITVVASLVGMGARDILLLAGIAAGAALVTGLVGVLALRFLRRSSLGQQIMIVALTVITACGVGAWAAARAMFISVHDLAALGVVLVAAATVAALVALPLAQRFVAESQALVAMARRIGEQGRPRDLDLPSTGPARGLVSPHPPGLRPFPGHILSRSWASQDRSCSKTALPPQTRELARLAAELERVADELARTREREQALEVSRRELIAWVSHDLRTPLSAIRAVTQALEEGVVTDADTVARYYRTLRSETDRLSTLVDDLFELSRAQAGVRTLPLERVSLEDLVSDALAGANPVAQAKGVRLHGRLEGPSPEVDVSARDVSRAVGNLLDNAIRHSPPDATVDVVAGLDDQGVYIAVTDACGGIPDQHLARVFDVGYRGTVARTPQQDAGAGLGLAIARGIAEAHLGSLDVHNEQTGCCFELRLPEAR